FRKCERRWRDQLPLGLAERLMSFPGARERTLAAGVRELHRDLGLAVGMNEVGDALPGRHMLGLVHAGAMQADAALGQDVCHFGDDQPGASDGAAAEMDEVPV